MMCGNDDNNKGIEEINDMVNGKDNSSYGSSGESSTILDPRISKNLDLLNDCADRLNETTSELTHIEDQYKLMIKKIERLLAQYYIQHKRSIEKTRKYLICLLSLKNEADSCYVHIMNYEASLFALDQCKTICNRLENDIINNKKNNDINSCIESLQQLNETNEKLDYWSKRLIEHESIRNNSINAVKSRYNGSITEIRRYKPQCNPGLLYFRQKLFFYKCMFKVVRYIGELQQIVLDMNKNYNDLLMASNHLTLELQHKNISHSNNSTNTLLYNRSNSLTNKPFNITVERKLIDQIFNVIFHMTYICNTNIQDDILTISGSLPLRSDYSIIQSSNYSTQVGRLKNLSLFQSIDYGTFNSYVPVCPPLPTSSCSGLSLNNINKATTNTNEGSTSSCDITLEHKFSQLSICKHDSNDLNNACDNFNQSNCSHCNSTINLRENSILDTDPLVLTNTTTRSTTSNIPNNLSEAAVNTELPQHHLSATSDNNSSSVKTSRIDSVLSSGSNNNNNNTSTLKNHGDEVFSEKLDPKKSILQSSFADTTYIENSPIFSNKKISSPSHKKTKSDFTYKKPNLITIQTTNFPLSPPSSSVIDEENPGDLVLTNSDINSTKINMDLSAYGMNSSYINNIHLHIAVSLYKYCNMENMPKIEPNNNNNISNKSFFSI